jgi:hypothetical protein
MRTELHRNLGSRLNDVRKDMFVPIDNRNVGAYFHFNSGSRPTARVDSMRRQVCSSHRLAVRQGRNACDCGREDRGRARTEWKGLSLANEKTPARI